MFYIEGGCSPSSFYVPEPLNDCIAVAVFIDDFNDLENLAWEFGVDAMIIKSFWDSLEIQYAALDYYIPKQYLPVPIADHLDLLFESPGML